MHWTYKQAMYQVEVIESIVNRRLADADDPDVVHLRVRFELLRDVLGIAAKDMEEAQHGKV